MKNNDWYDDKALDHCKEHQLNIYSDGQRDVHEKLLHQGNLMAIEDKITEIEAQSKRDAEFAAFSKTLVKPIYKKQFIVAKEQFDKKIRELEKEIQALEKTCEQRRNRAKDAEIESAALKAENALLRKMLLKVSDLGGCFQCNIDPNECDTCLTLEEVRQFIKKDLK